MRRLSHKVIAMLLSMIMLLPYVSMTAMADGENTAEITIQSDIPAANNSVSGYVSTTEGNQIAGLGLTININYDENEDKSVIRAIDDLQSDFKSVTGKDCTKSVNYSFSTQALPPHGINIYDDEIVVSTYNGVPADSVCYIASYTPDGALYALAQSTTPGIVVDGTTDSFLFDELPDRTEWGILKAFIWTGEDKMEPATDEVLDVEDHYTPIYIGTLGLNARVNNYAKENAQIAALEGKRESFTIQNINGSIVIAGSDKRGTIYGIYDLCEKMGVSPWKFWADVEPEKAENLYINLPDGGYTEGEPSVKYRGIFLNDEFNMNQWNNSEFAAGMNLAKYEKFYELILRLKMNFMWPAMHNYTTAFHKIDGAAAKADEYGIVVGSSHAEPLLRNNLGELYDYQVEWESRAENQGKTLYKALKDEKNHPVAYYWTDHDNNNASVDNKEFLEDYWRDSVKANGAYDNIYTLGMRGVHDGDFTTNMDKTTALNEIISTQYNILKEEIADKQNIDVKDIPKVFIPYKDVQELYNKGTLNIPDDVTIMWTDDNYGYVRQNANDAERARSGGAGLYHHISYYGNPTSYLWLSSTQPGLLREELTKAYETGADKMWILNVGDLKPAEKEIEYYARLSRDVEAMNETDISDVYAEMARRDFNFDEADAKEYADIMDTYYELANSKRPEFYRTNDADNNLALSPSAYGDEGARYIERYKDITQRAEALYEKLPENKKPSFYEFALYPIRSARNMAVDFVQADHASLYSSQSRGSVINSYSSEANAAAAQLETDTAYYNTMLSGKWNKMMVMNPSHFTSCDAKLTTKLNPPSVTSLDYTDMGVAVEGKTDCDALTLSKYDAYAKYIDIFNKGYGSFEYYITTTSPAIKLSKAAGTVYSSERVYVTLDTAQTAPASGSIKVTQKLGDDVVKEFTINVTIPSVPAAEDEKTYIEADGTVSIEAEHFTASEKAGDYEWRVEKDMGRSGDSLKLYPNLAADSAFSVTQVTEASATADYKVYFTESGEYNISAYRMPTLNERGNMRFAIGIDDNTPVIFNGNSSYSKINASDRNNLWARSVYANTQILTDKITIPSAGVHTVRLYSIAPWVVLDKIVLTRDTAPSSYFGAPESYNTTYNNEIIVPETVTDTKKDETGITKTFEPKAAAGEPSRAEGKITVPVYALESITDAVVMASGYDDNGQMTSVDFKRVTFTGGKVQAELSLPAETNNYLITVVDSFTDMHVIAPYIEHGTLPSRVSSGGFSVTENMSAHSGKKSVLLVADTAITEDITLEHIKYMYAETAEDKSYKNLPFAAEGGKKYYIRIGTDGETAVDEEFEATPVSYTILRELKDGSSSATSVLDSGSSYSGSVVSVSDLPIVIKENDNYYVLSENSDEDYTREWTLGKDAEQTLKVTYTLDKNIVSYVEFESFGKNVIENAAYSGGKAGRLSDDTIVKLLDNPAAGNYELTASVVNDKGNGFKLKYGDKADVSDTQWSPNIGLFSANFTLLEGNDLTKLQLSKNGASSPTFDYIIIRRVPENVSYTVKAVTSDGTELAEITPTAKTSIKAAGLPEVIEKDGKYYRVSDSMVGKNTHSKRITETLSEGDVVNVEYTLDESILFYKEMEDYENTTITESTACSKGKAAYVAYDHYAELGGMVFPAGKYQFEGYVVGRGTVVGLRFKKNISDSSNFMTIAYPLFDTDKQDIFTYNFELTEPTTLVMAGLSNTDGKAGTPTFDYIMIKALN